MGTKFSIQDPPQSLWVNLRFGNLLKRAKIDSKNLAKFNVTKALVTEIS